MRIFRSASLPHQTEAGLLVIGVFESSELAAPVAKIDGLLGGHLKEHVSSEDFKGKEGALLSMHTHGKIPARKVLLLGLGEKKAFTARKFRTAAARAVRAAEAQKTASLALWLPFDRPESADVAKAAAEGASLAAYRFTAYKKDAKTKLEEVAMLGPSRLSVKTFDAALELGTQFAAASLYARDLVNTPSLDMTPRHLAKEAEKLAEATPNRITLKTYGRAELKKMGCGGILAVAQGSEHEPQFVHLKYRPVGKAKKRVVLVGKGVTFDSGGLSIKPADAMMDMKIDMAGAAAVLAVFKVLPLLKLPIEVHGLAALVENMPSGTAIRPGDIVETMSGKTIEILNTDAEGRVTLADALHYGTTLKPDLMVDLATLTGACMVALGQDLSALMTDDEKLSTRLHGAGEAAGEPLWRLPLVPEYAELIKSRHADVKNIGGGRYGGAITAGLFLKEFVGATPWAHLDIAGPAYNEKDYNDERSWGASGYGARLLLEFLKKL